MLSPAVTLIETFTISLTGTCKDPQDHRSTGLGEFGDPGTPCHLQTGDMMTFYDSITGSRPGFFLKRA